jgi:hypothetical protein
MAPEPLVGQGLLIIEDPLDEWSARRRDLYLTTHNTHKKRTIMLPLNLEPAMPAAAVPRFCTARSLESAPFVNEIMWENVVELDGLQMSI